MYSWRRVGATAAAAAATWCCGAWGASSYSSAQAAAGAAPHVRATAAPCGAGRGPSPMQAMFDCASKGCDSGKTHDFSAMFAKMSGAGAEAAGGAPDAGAGAGAATLPRGGRQPKYVCPSKDDIGMCTWTTLHVIAAQYPEVADADTQAKAIGLIEGLARFFPCEMCRVDFAESIRRFPPRVSTKREFVLWLCHQHNLVNRKINKPVFACDFEALEERWYRPCLPDDENGDEEEEGGEEE